MGILILVRHGQSTWNLENRFTGWTDVPLTPAGEKDAVLCGASLKHFTIDIAFVSRLQRSKQTLVGIEEGYGRTILPVVEDSALNERHYGDLQGLNKAEMVKKYGEEQVHAWRRSYATRPPNGESIEDCVRRVWPFFQHYILPELRAGKTVLVAAHGNSMRPIIMHLDAMSGDDVAVLEVPLCVPFVYTFDGEKTIKKEILNVPGMEEKNTAKIV